MVPERGMDHLPLLLNRDKRVRQNLEQIPSQPGDANQLIEPMLTGGHLLFRLSLSEKGMGIFLSDDQVFQFLASLSRSFMNPWTSASFSLALTEWRRSFSATLMERVRHFLAQLAGKPRFFLFELPPGLLRQPPRFRFSILQKLFPDFLSFHLGLGQDAGRLVLSLHQFLLVLSLELIGAQLRAGGVINGFADAVFPFLERRDERFPGDFAEQENQSGKTDDRPDDEAGVGVE